MRHAQRAATNAVRRRERDASGVTPCVLEGKRGFSPERGERPAISFGDKLGCTSCSARVSEQDFASRRHDSVERRTPDTSTTVIVFVPDALAWRPTRPPSLLPNQRVSPLRDGCYKRPAQRVLDAERARRRADGRSRLAGASRAEGCRGLRNDRPNAPSVSCGEAPRAGGLCGTLSVPRLTPSGGRSEMQAA